MNLCRVLLVDDEAMILEGYQKVFDWKQYQCEVVGTAMDGEEAVRKAEELKPDIVIMDINLPRINGNGISEELPIRDLCALPSYVARYEFPAFSVMIDYEDSVFFKRGETRKFKVKVVNSNTMREQQWVKIKLYLPDGVETVGASVAELPLNNLYLACAEKEFELNTEAFKESRLELIVDISLAGRHSSGPVKMVLFAGE